MIIYTRQELLLAVIANTQKFLAIFLRMPRLKNVWIFYIHRQMKQEAIKLFSNTYLALRVAFLMNSIRMQCQKASILNELYKA